LVQGSPVSTIFHGLPVYELANLLGFDAATLGNHEFDYGWAQAQKFMEAAKYPIVSSNFVDGKNELFTSKPYAILKVNGLRVAVIGAITEDMPNLSTPSLMGRWHAAPLIPAVRRYAAEVRDKSDIIVLLAHVRSEEEAELLASAPEISVIVTGHVHDGFAEPMTRQGRVLVRVKSNAEELGKLKLQVDVSKKAPVSFEWTRIPITTSSLRPAVDVAAQVKRWEDEVKARVDMPLAVSRRAVGRAELKRLMERAMCEETGSDFAFMNSGGVRDTLPQGQLLVRHIWNIMPFDNRLLIAKVKGRDLPKTVLDGRTVEPERVYALAASDFSAQNQGAPSQLGVTGLRFDQDAGLLRDVLVDWFRKKKVIE
jgi:5'-nucleotidase / UDP-sugar diphosphatase